jgi:hypothetical protein
VSFTLHDSNADGSIDFTEYESMVRSHITVTLVCSPIAHSKVLESGQSTADLAAAVASECFAALGLNYSQTMTLEMVCEVANDCLVLAENIPM